MGGDKVRFRFSYLGIWAPYCWMSWMNTNNVNLPHGFPWRMLYLGITVSMAIVTIAMLFAKGAVPRESGQMTKALDWLSAIIMALCAFVTAAPAYLGASAGIAAVGTIAGGLAVGWMYLRWAVFLTRVETTTAAIALFGGSLIRPFIELFLCFMPPFINVAFGVAFPFASSFLLGDALGHMPQALPPVLHYERNRFLKLWRVWVMLIAVSLSLSILVATEEPRYYGMTLQSNQMIIICTSALTAVLYAGMLFWAVKTDWAFGFNLLWSIILVVVGFVLLFMIVAPDNVFMIHVLISSAQSIIMPILWLTVCDIARHTDMNPFAACGVGLVAYNLPTFLGVFVDSALLNVFDIDVLPAIVLFFLFIVLAVCPNSVDSSMRLIFDDLRGRSTLPSDFETIDQRCQALGMQYGLTEREIEVMRMICKGRSRTFIADSLFISENTVKAHVSHSYGKIGIHSRRDLQELLGI